MGRPPIAEITGELKRGQWTPDEDIMLVSYIQEHGPGNWRLVPRNAGLRRCGKSCRLRWKNYLRPGIKREKFTLEEDRVIIHYQALYGNRWAAIAAHLPGRTDNDVKNYWHTQLKKKKLGEVNSSTDTGISPIEKLLLQGPSAPLPEALSAAAPAYVPVPHVFPAPAPAAAAIPQLHSAPASAAVSHVFPAPVPLVSVAPTPASASTLVSAPVPQVFPARLSLPQVLPVGAPPPYSQVPSAPAAAAAPFYHGQSSFGPFY